MQYCADARRGYPDVTDAARRTFLTRLAEENCADGWRYRVGDHADLSIGQGETTVSPLQLAIGYSALVNGGTVWEPRIGRAVLGPDGRVVREIKARPRGKVPVSAQLLGYIRSSLAFTPANGASGSAAFAGFPLDKVLVGGKTGTAEVFGKQDTSWFASWAPATGTARYVVVAMIEQAGLGAQAAAPVARAIYEGIYGLNGKRAAFRGGVAPTGVPRVTGDAAARSDRRPPAASPSRGPGGPGGTGGTAGTGTPGAGPAPDPSTPPAAAPAPAGTTRAPRRGSRADRGSARRTSVRRGRTPRRGRRSRAPGAGEPAEAQGQLSPRGADCAFDAGPGGAGRGRAGVG